MIVLSDVCMPGCNGIDLMTLFHQDDNQLPILLITGHGDVPMAVDAVKKGAWDFLQKPVDHGKLLVLVEDALRQRKSVIARRHYCQQKLQLNWSATVTGLISTASAYGNWLKRILPSGFMASREPDV